VEGWASSRAEVGRFLAPTRRVRHQCQHPWPIGRTATRYGRWLWVHNGLVRDFHRTKRELALVVNQSLNGLAVPGLRRGLSATIVHVTSGRQS
jgi:hypothetical protein